MFFFLLPALGRNKYRADFQEFAGNGTQEKKQPAHQHPVLAVTSIEFQTTKTLKEDS